MAGALPCCLHHRLRSKSLQPNSHSTAVDLPHPGGPRTSTLVPVSARMAPLTASHTSKSSSISCVSQLKDADSLVRASNSGCCCCCCCCAGTGSARSSTPAVLAGGASLLAGVEAAAAASLLAASFSTVPAFESVSLLSSASVESPSS
jgi:hypothetical protein